jgi:hypothetical protein
MPSFLRGLDEWKEINDNQKNLADEALGQNVKSRIIEHK